MNSETVRRLPADWIVGLLAFAAICLSLATGGTVCLADTRAIDPAQVVPIDQIAPEHRESVAEVIRDPTFHRKGAPETFPCNSKVYLCLLNEPGLTLALWKDLSASQVKLKQVGPNRYEGTDGNGASAVWDFAYRSPKLHVLSCNLNYTTPRGSARLEARIVLVVHAGFYREVNGEPWVQHDIEAFVKVDSKGWKAVARTLRPVLEKVLEDQVREAGYFVSLMGRLVAMYPNWACQVTMSQADIAADTCQKFRAIVIQNRRPGAFTGRPTLAEKAEPKLQTR